ncbi:uncharacterized protein P174DRAFT_96291 [Aspergillus novofumigatus IBT 16806]|uniref:Uncharacterized protein n=1 Tax=Aspergillus novofumigatus (strain IBT 16806) TaxID=1392255 RepID=A0A2I1CH72_ASPN1|nr:uncharacterized protein P174DRAFT_96291 [Aspergillus novofumigatus IBT 16806]PKX96973.1 hypothetical protein P174DRAFT_96291 [Aspergillus novofumigatus IBT 16806]
MQARFAGPGSQHLEVMHKAKKGKLKPDQSRRKLPQMEYDRRVYQQKQKKKAKGMPEEQASWFVA